MMWRLAGVLLLGFVALSYGSEQDVLDLGDDDFASTLKQHETTLVMFYAPWWVGGRGRGAILHLHIKGVPHHMRCVCDSWLISLLRLQLNSILDSDSPAFVWNRQVHVSDCRHKKTERETKRERERHKDDEPVLVCCRPF